MSITGKKIFVTGIDTGIGKTIVSAIVTKALRADYWKPVQCGDLESSDSMTVKSLINDSALSIHPEQFRLKEPASPHRAAKMEGQTIRIHDFKPPETSNHLVVEGAGGALVPLNDRDYIVDLAASFAWSVVVVCRHYLGSLNHTLLTVEALRNRGLALNGLVFNGPEDSDYESFLSQKSGLPVLLRVGQEETFTPELVDYYAKSFKLYPEVT